MNYYIADLHINHNNVIKFDNRPFSSVIEMNDTILHNWNSVVSKNDTVYIIGDFIWDKESAWEEIIKSFNGHKVLIRGNHDPKQFSYKVKNLFDDIKDYKEISDNGRTVIMCHYPIPFCKKTYDENTYMLYGHVHTTREYDFMNDFRNIILNSRIKPNDARGQFINVGCMLPYMNYTPKTLDQLIETAL